MVVSLSRKDACILRMTRQFPSKRNAPQLRLYKCSHVEVQTTQFAHALPKPFCRNFALPASRTGLTKCYHPELTSKTKCVPTNFGRSVKASCEDTCLHTARQSS